MAESTGGLVVVGASAGGVDALSTLVGGLATGFPAPVVVAQHLDPSRASHLGEILAQRASLPVRTVVDREPLEPGVIFVVPSDCHVMITDSEVSVHTERSQRPKPSVDLLFSSAAQAYGERLIAVVLTGTGSDGAAGAREVKQAGGTVIIQNPDTAAFPGMPEALAPTTVDIVGDIDAIGTILRDLLTGSYIPSRPDDEQSLRSLLDDLRERSGIDFTTYKTPTIIRRLQRRIAATGTDDLAGYIRYLQGHPDEYLRLVSSFLIKMTEFFRDPDLFAYLRQEVLPELIESARSRNYELRFWSAGCATGEEVYSLAILVAEVLGDELGQFNVRLFATDLDAEAVAFARRGIYPPAALSAMSSDLISRYFNQVGDSYEIKKSVRNMAVFGQHDLGRRAPFPRIDLALCRNVLIYFTAELQKRALLLFATSLREGGYLVLGKAETASPLGDHFRLAHPQLRIYRRHGDPLLISAAGIRDTTPTFHTRMPVIRRPFVAVDFARDQKEVQRSPTSIEKVGTVLFKSPLGMVLVDRRYDIQTINAAARRLLGIHSAAVGEDLIHLTQQTIARDLRKAIDSAFTLAAPSVVQEGVTDDVVVGQPRYLRITCYPNNGWVDGGQTDAVLVVVADVTEAVQQRLELEQALVRRQEEMDRQVGALRDELSRAQAARVGDSAHLQAQVQALAESNRQLLAANQELTSANMELRGANEEFVISNEEAQAATEEVETLNEELQATNEELETLNEELQATVEELNTTNDDLQARTTELQSLAASLEAQRQGAEDARGRLEAILAGMDDAVLVVGGEGEEILANPAYHALFAQDGLLLEDSVGQPLPPDQHPARRAAGGAPFTLRFALAAPDGTHRWFDAKGQPVPGLTDAQGGGVLVIHEVEGSAEH